MGRRSRLCRPVSAERGGCAVRSGARPFCWGSRVACGDRCRCRLSRARSARPRAAAPPAPACCSDKLEDERRELFMK